MPGLHAFLSVYLDLHPTSLPPNSLSLFLLSPCSIWSRLILICFAFSLWVVAIIIILTILLLLCGICVFSIPPIMAGAEHEIFDVCNWILCMALDIKARLALISLACGVGWVLKTSSVLWIQSLQNETSKQTNIRQPTKHGKEYVIFYLVKWIRPNVFQREYNYVAISWY